MQSRLLRPVCDLMVLFFLLAGILPNRFWEEASFVCGKFHSTDFLFLLKVSQRHFWAQWPWDKCWWLNTEHWSESSTIYNEGRTHVTLMINTRCLFCVCACMSSCNHIHVFLYMFPLYAYLHVFLCASMCCYLSVSSLVCSCLFLSLVPVTIKLGWDWWAPPSSPLCCWDRGWLSLPYHIPAWPQTHDTPSLPSPTARTIQLKKRETKNSSIIDKTEIQVQK